MVQMFGSYVSMIISIRVFSFHLVFRFPLHFPSHRFQPKNCEAWIFFRGSSPLGCGEREELRTFTMELSTFQQVPFPVVQTMVDSVGMPVAKLQELDMNKDRSPESKCDVCLLQ